MHLVQGMKSQEFEFPHVSNFWKEINNINKCVEELKKGTLMLWTLPYLPAYNAHFFPAEKAPKIEMRIIHGILCFRLASLISM